MQLGQLEEELTCRVSGHGSILAGAGRWKVTPSGLGPLGTFRLWLSFVLSPCRLVMWNRPSVYSWFKNICISSFQ